VVWRCAARLGGPCAGLTALSLAAFDPSSIAAASTANLDFPNAAFSFFALVAAHRAFAEPGAWRTLVAGVALGAALLTKFTALLLAPALLLLCAAAARERRSWRPAGILALMGLAAFSTFAAGYGFESRSLESVKGHPKYMSPGGAILERSAIRGPIEAIFGESAGIPLLTAVKGLDHTLSETGQIGHRGYLLGESNLEVERTDPDTGRKLPTSYVGWKEFYAVILLQKLPLTTLLLVAAGAVYAARRAASWLDRIFFLVFPATVLLQFSLSDAQLGIKYVLPALPPLFAAAGMLASRPRWGPWIVGIALVGSLQATLRLHPDEAMFASVLAGGPSHGARVACVGDDWGQDAPGLALFAKDLDAVGAAAEAPGAPALAEALVTFRARHGGELRGPVASAPASGGTPGDPLIPIARALHSGGLAYRYYGEGDPTAYGYGFDPLPAGPRRGLVAVHATNLYRENQDFSWLERFDPKATEGEPMPGIFGACVAGRWIVSHEPVAKIGNAIYVYFIE
jgi:hypothetical protein